MDTDTDTCYVCRRDMDGEMTTATLRYYVEALTGGDTRVPVHGKCKKGEVMIQTESGLMWQRN